MFGTNIASVFFYVVVGIIVVIIIPILLYRYFKEDSSESKNRSSKSLFKIIYSISRTIELESFYNVLVKHNFKGKKYIHVPAGIIGKNNIFLFSDVVEKKYYSFEYKNGQVLCLNKKNNRIVAKNINFPEIKEFNDILCKKNNLNKDNTYFVILHNGQKIQKINNIYFVPKILIVDFIKEKDTNDDKQNLNYIKSWIIKNNLIKSNFKKRNFERMLN